MTEATPDTVRQLSARIQGLEAQRRRGHLVLALITLLGLTLAWRTGQDPEVLYARGLVIVDEAGRERILIGSPLPRSAHRIRTDPDKARSAWGDRFGGQMDWYENVRHDTTGMVILDENGHDRLSLGDPVIDPPNGRRIGTGPGIVINDGEGFERSGWSYFDDRDQVGFGLDRASGEGINLFLLADGSTGIFLRDEGREHMSYLGYAAKNNPFTGMEQPLNGLLLFDKLRPRLLMDSAGVEPGLELRDEDGALVEAIWR